MKKPHLPQIREHLRTNSDGMTINQLRELMGYEGRNNTIRKCLERMPDAYIDRWILNPGKRGQYEAVWCVVVPPPHCPDPRERYSRAIKTVWAGVPT